MLTAALLLEEPAPGTADGPIFIGQAAAIVSANGFEESDTFGGFPILADGKYFEGKIIEAKPEKKTTSKKK